MGIGPLPVPVALPGLADRSLVRVLPTHRLQKLNIYALYASRRYLDAKIRTFVDFLREKVPLMLAEQEAALSASGEETPRRRPASPLRIRGTRDLERLRLVN